MKHIDEFRDKKIAKRILDEIFKLKIGRINLMEICGTHTMAIFKSGIKQLLPPDINLVSGPGCPVCVTAQEDIDRMIELAKIKDTIIITFGDMLKVPGNKSSLEKERAKGADIRIVYSPSEALKIARENKNRETVFLAVGFETTSPTTALVIKDAQKTKTGNFSVYCSHKLIPAALKALIRTDELRLDGFICPGHVSIVIGSRAYEFIARDYKIPCVISGFEPVDILGAILMLLKQISRKEAKVEIGYSRAVHPEGNKLAQKALSEVFETGNACWRGLGIIKNSGYRLNKKYRDFDAGKKFNLSPFGKNRLKNSPQETDGCLCGEVLRGIKNPAQCPLFAKACSPENPYGPCMVSSEGTCAAWYKYSPSRAKLNR